MSTAAPADKDIAALARGGRTNFFGFLLRLAARLPFLFVAGRFYGAEALGRFAYAVLIVEFAAQLATLGLKRGLAQQLSNTEKPHVCVVWDAMLVAFIASAVASAILIAFPQAMFPNSPINGIEWLLPLIVFAIAGSDIALAALAYQHNVKATVTARAIVEPWTISIAATLLFFTLSKRDGLIIAYVLSMVAALGASLWPLFKAYGWPHGWRPEVRGLWALTRRNMPLAAADAIEWGSRRIDIAILGLFFSPAIVGIYYVAQQVASLPQKLKTSFDPILGPVITQKLAEDDKPAVARQVRQVGFWIIAAQVGIALALGIPGEAVMGLVGPNFVGGTAALGFLLAAEAVAATAVVSEAALVYVARHRNLMISLAMVAVQVALSIALILAARAAQWPESWQAAGPALGLMLALGLSSILKARLLSRLLGAPVQGWRWPLVWATGAAVVVGWCFTLLPPNLEWVELVFGIPAILGAFGYIMWRKGFTREDRALFRSHAPEEDATLPPAKLAPRES
ncbi:lipopolysaccharide biosynthesis protein [Allosphingosinicella indica]|uniref:Membrane protein involved in the export of O-antigen and teichoic acid n=1 Tax=Allosphingosinicella indica TaxID=941907 RepID=A0A1X7G3I8_9SPHN|nr:oligosaccharide flippase family protein [Allosphingosinicella indica]SMF63414.1 Membrane protein involved in the export of O-antigen and teichoic acid [Allosphingosinicella indica]